MWRRATAAWAVAACGCSFEVLDIRLRDGGVELAVLAGDAAGPDVAPDVRPDGQRSCMPPAPGCGQARIVGGTFAMGDPAAYDSRGVGNRAVPVQPSITVSTFMLDRYEVTVARFRRFVSAMRLSVGVGFDDSMRSSFCNWTSTPGDREGHPMNCVDWQTASDFCVWDTGGGALPTEAQWEYAARGSMNRPWPWGGPDSAMPDGRVCWNRSSGTCLEEDAAFATGATPDGVWHLVGNVWEWTADWYVPYMDATCWDGQARTDPLCAYASGGFRSFRGGAWGYTEGWYVRSGTRSDYPPMSRYISVGFRCAETAR